MKDKVNPPPPPLLLVSTCQVILQGLLFPAGKENPPKIFHSSGVVGKSCLFLKETDVYTSQPAGKEQSHFILETILWGPESGFPVGMAAEEGFEPRSTRTHKTQRLSHTSFSTLQLGLLAKLLETLKAGYFEAMCGKSGSKETGKFLEIRVGDSHMHVA